MRTEYGKIIGIADANEAEAAFIKSKELRFSYCQLVYKPDEYTKEAAKIILAASKKHSMPIVSFFAGYKDGCYGVGMSDSFKIQE